MSTWPILHWSFNPIALSLGPLAVRWYGLCWGAAFLLGDLSARRILRAHGRTDIDTTGFMTYALFGTILGARLVHCVFYDPAYYLAHPLRILAIWEGGLASHGGAIGLIAGLALGARRFGAGVPRLTLLDVAAIPAAFGAVLIRVANFLNSEIIGNPTSGSWGVVFESVDAIPRHPVQLYEAAAYLVIWGLLQALLRFDDALARRGYLTGAFLALVFGARLVLEHWKVPQAAYEAGFALSVGQWLSLPFIALGLVLAVRARRAAPDTAWARA
jgi:prolipoprotein diacylglyceryl transferase